MRSSSTSMMRAWNMAAPPSGVDRERQEELRRIRPPYGHLAAELVGQQPHKLQAECRGLRHIEMIGNPDAVVTDQKHRLAGLVAGDLDRDLATAFVRESVLQGIGDELVHH